MRFFLLFVFVVASVFANPLWYYNVQSTKAHSYVGYGSGESEADARQEAFNDIASQISVSVDNSFSQKQIVQGSDVQSTQDFSSTQKSKATLYDYELLKSEFADGKYFVAIEYENIPSFDKFVNKIKSSKVELKDERQNSYLAKTQIAKKLKRELGKNIDFSLVRKDAKWYIKYKNILQVLDSRDFGMFFSTQTNKDASINTNKPRDVLYNEDRFFFKVKSSKKIYASILTIYEDGTVSTLVRNIALTKDKLEKIPDEDFETIPEAGLLHNGIETYDLTLRTFQFLQLQIRHLISSNKQLHSQSEVI